MHEWWERRSRGSRHSIPKQPKYQVAAPAELRTPNCSERRIIDRGSHSLQQELGPDIGTATRTRGSSLALRIQLYATALTTWCCPTVGHNFPARPQLVRVRPTSMPRQRRLTSWHSFRPARLSFGPTRRVDEREDSPGLDRDGAKDFQRHGLLNESCQVLHDSTLPYQTCPGG